MNKLKRGFFAILLAGIMIISGAMPAEAQALASAEAVENILDALAQSEITAHPSPGFGSAGGEWMMMGLARYGFVTESYKESYLDNLEDVLYDCGGQLSTRTYTEYSRVAIALTALGEDAGNFRGYSLIRPLSEYTKVARQGVTGLSCALLALDSGSYSIPALPEGSASEKTSREKIVRALLNAQSPDGGWNLTGTGAAADVTAIAIQALAAYVDSDEEVKKAVDKGLDALSGMQEESGGYSVSGKENAETCAQVLTAISELRISVTDSRFVKKGHTVADGLMRFYTGGGFSHTLNGKNNTIATEQAIYALVAYDRCLTGKNRLYDMTDGFSARNEAGSNGESGQKNDVNSDSNQNGSKDKTVVEGQNKPGTSSNTQHGVVSGKNKETASNQGGRVSGKNKKTASNQGVVSGKNKEAESNQGGGASGKNKEAAANQNGGVSDNNKATADDNTGIAGQNPDNAGKENNSGQKANSESGTKAGSKETAFMETAETDGTVTKAPDGSAAGLSPAESGTDENNAAAVRRRAVLIAAACLLALSAAVAVSTAVKRGEKKKKSRDKS